MAVSYTRSYRVHGKINIEQQYQVLFGKSNSPGYIKESNKNQTQGYDIL